MKFSHTAGERLWKTNTAQQLKIPNFMVSQLLQGLKDMFKISVFSAVKMCFTSSE